MAETKRLWAFDATAGYENYTFRIAEIPVIPKLIKDGGALGVG